MTFPAKTQRTWQDFITLLARRGVRDNDTARMQRVVREFALELIKDQSDDDSIMVGTQTLMRFGPEYQFASKQQFIAHHSRNGTWGNDAILYTVTEALGYSLTVNLKKTGLKPYTPFEQTAVGTGLTMNIENIGAPQQGTHWQLSHTSSSYDGNCMYTSIAQQIQRDLPAVRKELKKLNIPVPPITTTPAVTPAVTNTVTNNVVNTTNTTSPVNSVNKENFDIEEIETEFAKQESIDYERYIHTYKILEQISTKKLIEFYHYAVKNLVQGDTYLTGRLKYITQEQGNNVVEQAILTGKYDNTKNDAVREELIHMLAQEAWRNPTAYKALIKNETPSLSMLFKPQTEAKKNCHTEVANETATDTAIPVPTVS